MVEEDQQTIDTIPGSGSYLKLGGSGNCEKKTPKVEEKQELTRESRGEPMERRITQGKAKGSEERCV